MIALKRAYDPASREDGVRFLVERLWSRGVTKEEREYLERERHRRSAPAARRADERGARLTA